MKIALHNLVELPAGKTLSEVLPALAHVKEHIHIGTPSPVCAGCRKPFNEVRKRRKGFRLYPLAVCRVAPIAFACSLCGKCFAQYQKGGDDREALLAAIDSFDEGEEANQ